MKKLLLILVVAFAGVVSFNALGISPINSVYAAESQDEWEKQGWTKKSVDAYSANNGAAVYGCSLYYKNGEYMLVCYGNSGKVVRAKNSKPFVNKNVAVRQTSFTSQATVGSVTYYFNLK